MLPSEENSNQRDPVVARLIERFEKAAAEERQQQQEQQTQNENDGSSEPTSPPEVDEASDRG